jgi:hypothetical protein
LVGRLGRKYKEYTKTRQNEEKEFSGYFYPSNPAEFSVGRGLDDFFAWTLQYLFSNAFTRPENSR